MDHFMGKVNSKKHKSACSLYNFKIILVRHKCGLVRILCHMINKQYNDKQLWQSYTKGPCPNITLTK